MPPRLRSMKRRKQANGRKRTVKAIKRLARRTRVPPTRTHRSHTTRRRRPRTLEEHLKEEGWI